MVNEAEANAAIEKYADTIRRICFIHLKNHNDVEDIFQEVFLKYILYNKKFESDAHEKAWLIRVTINASKDLLKSFFKKKICYLDELNIEPTYLENKNLDLINYVLGLPDNYKNVIYLFYYENYSAIEIAKILNKNENTIYTWLKRGRETLKKNLGGEFFE